jgi:hypothetical protein
MHKYNMMTSINIEVMTVKGYAENGYKLGRIDFNDIDYFIAPWYNPSEGFYSRLLIGQKVLTKKVPGSTRLCHIIGLVRNSIEDSVGIVSNLDNERILNTNVEPNSDEVSVFKRGVGSLRFKKESIELATQYRQGLKIIGTPNSFESNMLRLIDSDMSFSSGSSHFSGKMLRQFNTQKRHFATSIENFGQFDESFFKKFRQVGMFPESKVSELYLKHNLPRVYNRFTSNHMPSDFFGFDHLRKIHTLRRKSEPGQNSDYYDLLNNPFYRHFFLPNETLFFISGGIFSKSGYELDINFNEMIYGNIGEIPILSNSFRETEALFKRGQSFFFSTNNSVFNDSDVKSNIEKNNFIISDREGFTKINLNKSSFSGNIPVMTETSYDSSQISIKNKTERNPIVFRSAEGNTYPKVAEEERPSGIRYSSVSRFSNSKEESEFVSSPTRYHNMVAAAEQLLANYSSKVIISAGSSNRQGRVSRENFERRAGISSFEDSEVSPGGEYYFADGSSYVIVKPTKPAISSGGSKEKLYIAGDMVSKQKPLSNDFRTESDGGIYKNNNYDSSGGYSLLLDSAGAIISSIGKSDTDGVSVLMDTEGSVVSWIGKDSNNRSIVTQTDGSVNICVGGPELNKGSENVFNEGRFELRVNVADKGFVGEDMSNEVQASDYIISISKEGLVISGGGKNSPILISSKGHLNLESQNGDVNLIANKGIIKYKRGSSDFNEIGYRDSEIRNKDLLN